MLSLKRYSCGCVGFALYENGTGDLIKVICVRACDGDGYDPEIGFFDRTADLSQKDSVDLTPAEAEAFINKIGKLVFAGNALAGLQSAMRVAGLTQGE